jgi:hypothetical protein
LNYQQYKFVQFLKIATHFNYGKMLSTRNISDNRWLDPWLAGPMTFSNKRKQKLTALKSASASDTRSKKQLFVLNQKAVFCGGFFAYKFNSRYETTLKSVRLP